MKVVKIYVTDIRIELTDITEYGDPAPGWQQMATKMSAAGIGFLDDYTRVTLDPIHLSPLEEQALSDLLESISVRISREASL